jgi:hypothetical protein
MPDVRLAFTAAPGLAPHLQESISNVWGTQYQLRQNPIEGLFTNDPIFGGYKSRLYNDIDAIDETTAVNDITARSAQSGATIRIDMTGSQRQMTGKIYDIAVGYSQWDAEQLGMMENPQNPTWEEMRNAANRNNLRYCLSQITANVTICASDGTMTGVKTFDQDSDTVAVNYKRNAGRDGTGEASTFNVDKLNFLRRKFVENQVAGQDVSGAENTKPIIVCCTDDIDNLASDKRVASAEYGGRKIDVLFDGQLKEWGGFRFLLLPKDILGATDGVRDIFAWAPGAFMFWTGNPFVRVSELPENKYMIQLYQGWRIAMMRRRGKAAVKVKVLA